MQYVHLVEGADPPTVDAPSPFKALVVLDQTTSKEWRARVSNWLIATGCVYMVAWGEECSLWDDSVDVAQMTQWGFKEVPDKEFAMTTWHEDEPLEEAMWFAKFAAVHPVHVDLPVALILHVGPSPREAELRATYARVAA